MIMKELSAAVIRQTPSAARARVFKRRRAVRDLPPLDVRTPSGRGVLPY
jgi:hypothetical protein